jgi:hypothetical protein
MSSFSTENRNQKAKVFFEQQSAENAGRMRASLVADDTFVQTI